MKKTISFLTSEIGRIAVGGTLFASALVAEGLELTALSWVLYILALLASGYKVYTDAVKGILRGDFLDEKFLMSIASIGAMIVGERSEGVAVMLFFLVGELFEHKAVAKSRKKIRSLMDICPDEAVIIRDGEEITVDAEDVIPGDTVIIRAGERVPVDCTVTEGFADADTSAITGESVPRPLSKGSYVESGVIVIGGALTCEAVREASESGAQRILDMVENANERKSREESFITVFSRFYTPIVVALALLLALIPPIFGVFSWKDSVYKALIFLVISCPCALVISVPMAFFGGIGAAASRGILFKGGNSFSPVARTECIAFDKTGTLTAGKFSIKGVTENKIPEKELLSLCASVEHGSNHPIAKSICKSVGEYDAADCVRELAGKGTVGTVSGFRVAVGNKLLMEEVGASLPECFDNTDETYVFCARDGEFIGALLISDELKSEAKSALEMLRKVGIKRTVILSGDKKTRAEKIANELSIDEVKAELLPEEKYAELEKIISEQNGKTMYVGDGINDAPSLMRADVGVAMGGIGSDSAIEASDLVIMSDNLKRLPESIKIARKTVAIAKENIIFAIGVKLSIMAFGAFGLANMWLAVFADVGVAVIAILNSMRTLVAGKRGKI